MADAQTGSATPPARQPHPLRARGSDQHDQPEHSRPSPTPASPSGSTTCPASVIETGNLAELINERNVVGVTTNPSIFQAALSKGDALRRRPAPTLADDGKTVDEVVARPHDRRTCATPATSSCPLYESTNGVDGRVSIEVDPRLAHDTDETVEQAKQLYAAVDRPNVLIKIPATVAGLPAITATIAEGISVNVTLIFSLDRYRAVMNAYLDGLEQAREAGNDLSKIHSVASFFVSRVDTEIDKRLDAIGTDEAKALGARPGSPTRGSPTRPTRRSSRRRAGRASLAEAAPTRSARCGPPPASRTRPTPTRSTSPSSSPRASSTRCRRRPSRPRPTTARSPATRSPATTPRPARPRRPRGAVGISYNDVVDLLETEGVDKFEKAWGELLDGVTAEMEKVTA